MIKKIQIALYIIAMAGFIVICAVFHSSWVVTINSLLGLTTIFLLSQGYIYGNMVGICQLAAYSYLAISNKMYGELVEIALITLPAYILSFYTWKKSSSTKILVAQKNIKAANYCIAGVVSVCLSLSMYFIFNTFGTENLIYSTIIFGINCLSCYLKIKRVKYNFIFTLASYIVSFALWGTFAFRGDLSFLPVMLNYVVYMIFCILGLFNWTKIEEKNQTQKSV